MAENNSPKTLGFSFDGTGNEPSAAGGFAENESITNILKLPILIGGGLGMTTPAQKRPSAMSNAFSSTTASAPWRVADGFHCLAARIRPATPC